MSETTTASATEELTTMVCDGAMRHAATVLRDAGIEPLNDLDHFCEVCRQTAHNAIGRLLGEWQEAAGANVGEGWLNVFINAQALELGKEIAAAFQFQCDAN